MSLLYLQHNLMICFWVVLLTIVEFFPFSRKCVQRLVTTVVTDSGDLKDHLVCHGGVKLSVCSDCPKSFCSNLLYFSINQSLSLFVSGNKNPYYLGLKESKIERKYT